MNAGPRAMNNSIHAARRRSLPRRSALVAAAMVVTLLTATACGSDNSAPRAATTTAARELIGIRRDPPLQVGDVVLPEVTDNRAPTPFTMKAAPGELMVVYFGYTRCPDVCPTSLAALRRAYRGIGSAASRISTVFVTVDYRGDTPVILDSYLASFFPAGRFHALRSTDDAELRAAEAPFLATSSITVKPDLTYEVAHSGTLYLVDDHGTVLIEWPFGTTATNLTNDLRQLTRDLRSAA